MKAIINAQIKFVVGITDFLSPSINITAGNNQFKSLKVTLNNITLAVIEKIAATIIFKYFFISTVD